ncbi:hypothetical protein SFRURICE_018396 [Spodoptera frugiperda]|nr:hypothetical protein SFRURICE_018396 [Spodoptera frugiperda]
MNDFEKRIVRPCRYFARLGGGTAVPPDFGIIIFGLGTGAFRTSPGGAGEPPPAPPPPLFLPPHLSHLSQHLNHLSQPFFPLKGWGAPCPCCPKEEARSSSVAELRRKAHEHSAALLHQLASFQSRALLPLPLPLPLPPLPLLPHDAPPTSQAHEPPKHLE